MQQIHGQGQAQKFLLEMLGNSLLGFPWALHTTMCFFRNLQIKIIAKDRLSTRHELLDLAKNSHPLETTWMLEGGKTLTPFLLGFCIASNIMTFGRMQNTSFHHFGRNSHSTVCYVEHC
jgi:hypothetical protein